MKKLLLILLFPLLLLSCKGEAENGGLPTLVAHAGGAVYGYRLTNSLEALDTAYNGGHRFVELDFEITSDGEINAPIDRIGESIIKRAVREDGEEAITKYKVLKSSSKATVLLVTPITGRTHQIRVHMAHIGHPIIGDELYGGDISYMHRQALHCLKMCFDGKNTFYAPLSDDISLLIRSYFGNEEFIPKNQ
jgi:hypothetical protein